MLIFHHLSEGKAIFIFKRALPLENHLVFVKLIKGTKTRGNRGGVLSVASMDFVKFQTCTNAKLMCVFVAEEFENGVPCSGKCVHF